MVHHRCVKCNRLYEEKSFQLIKGCTCGSRIFLMVKNPDKQDKIEDVSWLEKELSGVLAKTKKPITLDVENIRMLKRGVFELNLESLMSKKEPVVVRDQFGIYYVKLPEPKEEEF